MANTRVYYATQQVNIEGASGNSDWNFSDTTCAVHGLQSVGVDTNFPLEKLHEIGQQAIYENIEEIPDVTVNLSKVLDGNPLIYHLATVDSTSPTLAGRSTAECIVGIGIWPDTADSCDTTAAPSVCACSGLFTSSLRYSFSVDGNSTEDVTMVGNHKIWKNGDDHLTNPNTGLPWDTIAMSGAFASNNDSPPGVGGVSRRENVRFEYLTASGTDTNGMVADPDCTVLPPEVFGISASGTNEKSNGEDFDCHLRSITLNADLNRDAIYELGRFSPYTRYVNFPVDVTCSIEVVTSSGDMVSATESGVYTTGTGECGRLGNLADRTIRVATCEGTRISLGVKNKLSNVTYGGGDAGGDNATVTYEFSTNNDFTVLHSGDPNASGSAWWSARGDYLVTL